VPIAVGLLGAVSFALFERKNLFDSFLTTVGDLEKAGHIQPNTQATIRAAIGGPSALSYWSPALWAVGVVGFASACSLGVLFGISYRVPDYPTVETMLGKEAATPEMRIQLHRFEYHSRAAHVPRSEYENAFKSVLLPAITTPVSDEDIISGRSFDPAERARKVTDAERTRESERRLRQLVDDLIKATWNEIGQPIPTTPSS
jgi:hypothetical protein